jgi:hypothetical protein
MAAKTRFVRIKVDFVLDIGREFEGLPHELRGVETDIVGMLAAGLRRVVPRRSNMLIMPGTRYSLTCVPTAKAAARLGKTLQISHAISHASPEKITRKRSRRNQLMKRKKRHQEPRTR